MTPKWLRLAPAFLATLLCLVRPGTAAAQEEGFTAPAGGEVLSPGSTLAVRWAAPCAGDALDEVELVLSLDDGLTFPVRLTAEMPPCASGFRWHVPALPTTRGRLALRVGRGGRADSERIEAVSRSFSIASDPAAETEELFRGATEWWTRQALADVGAEDLLSESIHGQPEQLVLPDARPDMADPSSPLLSLPAHSSGAPLQPGGASRGADRPCPAPLRGAPVPLRL